MRAAGITLIEMLVVLAILGILLSIAVVNFSRWRASSAVRQGATEFSQAVDRTRTGAKRTNLCAELKLAATTAATSLTLNTYDSTKCSGATVTSTSTYTLPPGVTITQTSGGGNSIPFFPPYGTTTAAPQTYEVRWAANTTIKQAVRLTGLFGKVILK